MLFRFLKSSHLRSVAHATTPFFFDPHAHLAYKSMLIEHIKRNSRYNFIVLYLSVNCEYNDVYASYRPLYISEHDCNLIRNVKRQK